MNLFETSGILVKVAALELVVAAVLVLSGIEIFETLVNAAVNVADFEKPCCLPIKCEESWPVNLSKVLMTSFLTSFEFSFLFVKFD